MKAGTLAGKTLFVTGASRGIGLSIALRAAKDGANVIIAAKTVDPHPKLPGTIYSAADDIRAAGGKCLPCIVDVRDEGQVEEAVAKGAKEFGGIDVLVNNASAISLTGTLHTPIKRYDLMNQINARGTFLVSQKCIPHLLSSTNPHILNISPPINLDKRWFGPHVAYTMAKYGMSFCVLGMSEEFQSKGIAVNALWPRTAIYTAAMEMLGGGSEIKDQCRTPDIMADAAHAILTKDSKTYTGNFAIDEDVLKAEGVTDFSQYAVTPGHPLLPDFFLDEAPDHSSFVHGSPGKKSSEGESPTEATPGGAADAKVSNIIDRVKSMLTPEMVTKVKACYQFDVSGDDAGTWFIDLRSDGGAAGSGTPPAGAPDVTFKMKDKDFIAMFRGELKPANAFFSGKLKMEGPLQLALKLDKIMGQMHKAKM